jgi:hypothetical protein
MKGRAQKNIRAKLTIVLPENTTIYVLAGGLARAGVASSLLQAFATQIGAL